MVLDIASHSTSEIRVLEADRPEGEFRVIEARRHGVEYGLTHHGDRFLPGYQRRGPQLPPRQRARAGARPGELDPRSPLRSRREARLGGRLPRSPGPLGAARGTAADPGAHAGDRRAAPGSLPRAGLHRLAPREPGVRHHRPPVRLHLDGDARVGHRVRPGGPYLDGPEGDSGPGLRPEPVPERADLRRRAGRRPGAGLAGLQAPLRARRLAPAPAQRLRRVRGELRSRLQLQPAQPAGPRLRGRDRARARRRGAGAGVVRERQAAQQAEQLHRLHRRRRAPGAGAATPRRTVSRSAAAAPAAS